jgi:rubrerythrin
LLNELREASALEGHYVEFVRTGAAAQGEFHCADCGYGVTVNSTLPQCPMCAGTTWERLRRSSFRHTSAVVGSRP